jgi:hypothetical protein
MKVLEMSRLPGKEQLGVNPIKRALEEPVRQIANNAGFECSVVFSTLWRVKGVLDSMPKQELMRILGKPALWIRPRSNLCSGLECSYRKLKSVNIGRHSSLMLEEKM